MYVNYISVWTYNGYVFRTPNAVAITVNGSWAWPGGLWSANPGTNGIIIHYGYNWPSGYNGSEVCGEIAGQPGYPCETVHA